MLRNFLRPEFTNFHIKLECLSFLHSNLMFKRKAAAYPIGPPKRSSHFGYTLDLTNKHTLELAKKAWQGQTLQFFNIRKLGTFKVL
jgi:hypothetical protein